MLRLTFKSHAAPSKAGPSKEAAIELLKVAAKEGGVPTATVLEAIRVVEKAKLQARSHVLNVSLVALQIRASSDMSVT